MRSSLLPGARPVGFHISVGIAEGEREWGGLLGSVEFVCLLSDLNNVFGAQPG